MEEVDVDVQNFVLHNDPPIFTSNALERTTNDCPVTQSMREYRTIALRTRLLFELE